MVVNCQEWPKLLITITYKIMRFTKKEYQPSTRTVSTTPSLHELTLPQVHPYHQYDTLLHFFTSFLTDVRLHTLELKQLAYQVVGLDGGLLRDQWKGNTVPDCQVCEVQYMMAACRKLRQDIVNTIALLRGYCTGKTAIEQKISRIPDMLLGSRTSNQNSQNQCPNQALFPPQGQNREQIQKDFMLMTFRETKNKLEGQQILEKQRKDLNLLVPNSQKSRKLQGMTVIEQDWQECGAKSDRMTEQDSSQYFARAYELIALMKNELACHLDHEEIHAELSRPSPQRQMQIEKEGDIGDFILYQ